jgi:ribosomal protein L11 methylase PrmA
VEKLAIENIRKKKAECLKEIEDLKKTLMSKTYSELEIKYPDLYEKFKSERFDTLHCSEVFWVVKTNKSYHPMKHSQINSKL